MTRTGSRRIATQGELNIPEYTILARHEATKIRHIHCTVSAVSAVSAVSSQAQHTRQIFLLTNQHFERYKDRRRNSSSLGAQETNEGWSIRAR